MIEIEEIPITDATFTDVPLCRSCPESKVATIRITIKHTQDSAYANKFTLCSSCLEELQLWQKKS